MEKLLFADDFVFCILLKRKYRLNDNNKGVEPYIIILCMAL